MPRQAGATLRLQGGARGRWRKASQTPDREGRCVGEKFRQCRPPVLGERPEGREKHEGVQRRTHEALVLIIHIRDKKASGLWSVTTGREMDPRYTSKCWKTKAKQGFLSQLWITLFGAC